MLRVTRLALNFHKAHKNWSKNGILKPSPIRPSSKRFLLFNVVSPDSSCSACSWNVSSKKTRHFQYVQNPKVLVKHLALSAFSLIHAAIPSGVCWNRAYDHWFLSNDIGWTPSGSGSSCSSASCTFEMSVSFSIFALDPKEKMQKAIHATVNGKWSWFLRQIIQIITRLPFSSHNRLRTALCDALQLALGVSPFFQGGLELWSATFFFGCVASPIYRILQGTVPQRMGSRDSASSFYDVCFNFHHDTIPSVSSIVTFKYTLSQKWDVGAAFFTEERLRADWMAACYFLLLKLKQFFHKFDAGQTFQAPRFSTITA